MPAKVTHYIYFAPTYLCCIKIEWYALWTRASRVLPSVTLGS